MNALTNIDESKANKLAAGEALPAPAIAGHEGSRTVRAGFIPLVDAAVLIAAAEFGFAQKEGITLDLVKDVSWANVRDRLAFRQFDVAHMLSPMPLAAMLGLGSNPSPTITPFSLGRGGNAITLSSRLYAEMQKEGDLDTGATALANAQALATVIRRARADGRPPLTLGVTYPFSSHNYEFRYWLAAGGIDPDRDVKLVVVPPPMTSDALAAGAIEGFCVGAPWNMVASERGVGRIVATKQDIWPSAPEKVLGMRPDWADANPETVSRLIVALAAAARWCDAAENRAALAEVLSEPRYVAAPVDILRRVLAGRFTIDPEGNQRVVDDYFVFHTGFANFPRPSQALWIYSQMVRWGQTALSADGLEACTSAYRPDLYRRALGRLAPPAMDDFAAEGAMSDDRFMDGHIFDPKLIRDYVEAFPVKATSLPHASLDDI
ncbi:ABC transporter substrate-binding protein [Sinorhizobium fredii USDA 205]|uniref:ABC transporter substrate-binding protein n=1 Tax=Rhizobium fredii TaxID=380 RepID=A0A844ALS7_RHIFR|nr:CmpA/NrtA family ABC transporter substrate-binding protein [Sinorhizobium fredii]ASY72146.1 Nitrate ABC transporter, nitrate-binding protein [Sinorhizobium fredii CCBAU 83666]KSV84247.1 ABC transporter substrate-binding protein [Sinorhizobium fredii USDA 205]MQX12672.1 ABC transporter substrate-binding protein [Sinorhizobium fredii]GEC30764.1 nitrate transporter [Sinorhizobium fredii]GLS10315.1 nitrate transporter [Sinorhizobium fredii]